MAIDVFIKTDLCKQPYAQEKLQEERPIFRWMHNHPTVVKSAEVALAAFGVYSIKKGLSYYSQSVPAILIGCASIAVGVVAYKILDIFAPPTHNPSNHVFTPDRYEGVRLEYQGNVPVLTIETEDPFKAGYGHGFLLANEIYKIRKANAFALHTLSRKPRHPELIKTIDAVKRNLTEEHIEEIKGLVKGYNMKRQEWTFKGEPLTFEEMLLLHLLPDSLHLELKEMENWLVREFPSWVSDALKPMACTSVIDGNSLSGPIFGRNLDWTSLGIYGTYSMVIQRKTKNGVKTIDLGFPSFIGTLTGMNDHGLSVAMNVCKGETDYIQGMPAVFYNRLCLETSKSVEDVRQFISDQRPIGPFHLLIADVDDAMTVHFFQDQGRDFIRSWNKEQPLITTNFRYGPLGRTRPTPTLSEKRENTLEKYFKDLETIGDRESSDPVKWVERSLALPKVNCIRNIHHVVMHPKTLKFAISFDNGWAASQPLADIDTKAWFES